MQALARWLVARPLNSVLALGATMSLPLLSFLSGAVLVFAILHKGWRSAVLEAGGALALLGVFGLVLGTRLDFLLASALSVWAPALLLALLLQRTRSLTLTLQVAWLVTLGAMLVFFAAVGDPVPIWQGWIEAMGRTLSEQGLYEQAEMFTRDVAGTAGQMTMIAALVFWSVSVMSLVLGYKLHRQLPGTAARFGRFRDLDFGRVIALATAIASVAAWLGGWMPLENMAFVMFAMFWLQGLAIAHWSHGQKFLPTFGIVALYVLLPLLNVIVLLGLAVTGYIDAWFRFRRLKVAG